MNLKIAAWNTEQRLTTLTTKHRGTPEHILASIKKLNADILVLPEAYQNTTDPGIDEALRGMGYSWVDSTYDIAHFWRCRRTARRIDIPKWCLCL